MTMPRACCALARSTLSICIVSYYPYLAFLVVNGLRQEDFAETPDDDCGDGYRNDNHRDPNPQQACFLRIGRTEGGQRIGEKWDQNKQGNCQQHQAKYDNDGWNEKTPKAGVA